MKPVDKILVGVIITGTVALVVSQKVYIQELEKINRKNLTRNDFLYRSLVKTINKLTPDQWADVASDLEAEMDFTDIILNNEM